MTITHVKPLENTRNYQDQIVIVKDKTYKVIDNLPEYEQVIIKGEDAVEIMISVNDEFFEFMNIEDKF